MLARLPAEVVLDVLGAGVLSCAEIVRAAALSRRLCALVRDDALWARLARRWRIAPPDAPLSCAVSARAAADETGAWATVRSWRDLVLLHELAARHFGRDLGHSTLRAALFPSVQHVIPLAMDEDVVGMAVVPHRALLVLWSGSTILTYDLHTAQRRWSWGLPNHIARGWDLTREWHVIASVHAQGDYLVALVRYHDTQQHARYYVFRHADCGDGDGDGDSPAAGSSPGARARASSTPASSPSSKLDDIGLPPQPEPTAPPRPRPHRTDSGIYRSLGPLHSELLPGGALPLVQLVPPLLAVMARHTLTLYDLETKQVELATEIDLSWEPPRTQSADRSSAVMHEHDRRDPGPDTRRPPPGPGHAAGQDRYRPAAHAPPRGGGLEPPWEVGRPRIWAFNVDVQRGEVYMLCVIYNMAHSAQPFAAAACSDLVTGSRKWVVVPEAVAAPSQAPRDALTTELYRVHMPAPHRFGHQWTTKRPDRPETAGAAHQPGACSSAASPPLPAGGSSNGRPLPQAVQGRLERSSMLSIGTMQHVSTNDFSCSVSIDHEAGALVFHTGMVVIIVKRYPRSGLSTDCGLPTVVKPGQDHQATTVQDIKVLSVSMPDDPAAATEDKVEGEGESEGEGEAQVQVDPQAHAGELFATVLSPAHDTERTGALFPHPYRTRPFCSACGGRAFFCALHGDPMLVDYASAQTPGDMRVLCMGAAQHPSPCEVQRAAVRAGGPRGQNVYYDRRDQDWEQRGGDAWSGRPVTSHSSGSSSSSSIGTVTGTGTSMNMNMEAYLATQQAWMRRTTTRPPSYTCQGQLTTSAAYLLARSNEDNRASDRAPRLDFVRSWDLTTSALLRLAPHKAASVLSKRKLIPCPPKYENYLGECSSKRPTRSRSSRRRTRAL